MYLSLRILDAMFIAMNFNEIFISWSVENKCGMFIVDNGEKIPDIYLDVYRHIGIYIKEIITNS